MELNMALKPHAIQFLFERFGFDAVLYFDADIRVYGPLGALLEKLNHHSLILTPHLTRPLGDGGRPSDLDILRAGVYNGGFVLVRNCEEGKSFLRWWKSRLQDHCLVDLPNGLFVDQHWLDFVPSFFPQAVILREPGYNVAYWNLGERRIERTGDGWIANGQPLYFFHFSGFNPERPEGISRHQDRYSLSTLGEPERALFLDYAKEVLDRGYKQFKDLPYAYGFFDNGVAISDAARRAYYELPEISKSIQDPFSEEGYQKLVRFWNEAPSGLPRLAWSIYEQRPDVQKAFPDPGGADRVRFLAWLLSDGVAEHRIGRELLDSLWIEWEAALSGLRPMDRMRHRSLRWAMAARARVR
jgi:hypothetical protein